MPISDFLAVNVGFVSPLVLALAALVLAIFWMYQFVQLMLLEDIYFSARYDKIIWAAAFILVVPLAPFAFLMWKGAKSLNRK